MNQIFAFFKRMNIALKISKIFLDYSIISLLSQRIDSLKMIIAIDKLKAIFNLVFSQTLKQLKIYLDKIEWFRQYVSYYAQKILSLQKRKIRLLRYAFIKEQSRQQHSRRISIDDSSSTEINVFNQLQRFFSRFTFLIHFDKIKMLYIDIDVNKKRNYDVIIYHVKRKDDVESVVFNSSFKRVRTSNSLCFLARYCRQSKIDIDSLNSKWLFWYDQYASFVWWLWTQRILSLFTSITSLIQLLSIKSNSFLTT